MILAEIIGSTTKQKIAEVLIPEKFNELKYHQFIEFSLRASSIYDWIEVERENGRTFDNQLYYKMAECVSSVLGVSPVILSKLELNKQLWIESAWTILNNLCNSYEPKENNGVFRHNGKWYKVPNVVKSAIKKDIHPDGMLFEQFAEVCHVEKQLNDVLKSLEQKDKQQKTNSEDERIRQVYSYTLMKIAICLNDPREIPEGESFDKWLEEKTIEIKDIPADTALDTIFFLTGMPKDYAKIIGLQVILNDLKSDVLGMKTTNLIPIE